MNESPDDDFEGKILLPQGKDFVAYDGFKDEYAKLNIDDEGYISVLLFWGESLLVMERGDRKAGQK
jgi:hypothetical protein